MELIIVTGLSGAGKSQAIHCMEDLGYYCVDNMPPALIPEFLKLASDIERAAFVVDIRSKQFFDDLKESVAGIKKQGVSCKIMYLEASDEVLIKRYKETRRSHPLSVGGALIDDIKQEKKLLNALRKEADFVIDTSTMKSAALYAEISDLLVPGIAKDSFTITVESFGYKHGMLSEADWVLDARFLPNPFYVTSLKKLTGKNKKVKDYVLRSIEARDFIARVTGLVADIIPCYVREGKYHLVIGVGCTGGQHRSVAIAEELASQFKAMGKNVVVVHRDLK